MNSDPVHGLTGPALPQGLNTRTDKERRAMTKQLMFYEKVVPITAERHRGWSVLQGTNYGYAASINAAPLMCTEFQAAALDLPVVFGKSDEVYSPIVVLGIEQGKNLCVDADGAWTGPYLPAFVRRYPFVFAQGQQPNTFTLCLDEDFAGCDPEGNAGERLFDEKDKPTPFLDKALEFTRTYEAEQRRTIEFGKLLAKHDLLDPMQAAITMPDGAKRSVTGFFVINREKLKTLSGEALEEFFKRDALELVYYHLLSMKNMEKLRDRAAS